MLTAPVLALAALAIKLEDGGPVLFRQMRLGRGARPFEILKLRTMTVDAEKHRSDGVVEAGDPRITRVGNAAAPYGDRRAAPVLARRCAAT